MNSTEIALRLKKVTEYEQGMDLVRACGRRRDEILQRLSAIVIRPQGSALGQTPLRHQASLDGLEAIQRLDDEERALHVEQTHLATLETQCYEAAERSRVRAINEAAPKAIKAVPRAMSRVREALRALDNELAALNRDLNSVAEMLSLPAPEFPFSDAELSDIFRLREELWTTRTVATIVPAGLQPSNPGNFPLTAKLAFRWTSWDTYTLRRGPNWPTSEPPSHPGPAARLKANAEAA